MVAPPPDEILVRELHNPFSSQKSQDERLHDLFVACQPPLSSSQQVHVASSKGTGGVDLEEKPKYSERFSSNDVLFGIPLDVWRSVSKVDDTQVRRYRYKSSIEEARAMELLQMLLYINSGSNASFWIGFKTESKEFDALFTESSKYPLVGIVSIPTNRPISICGIYRKLEERFEMVYSIMELTAEVKTLKQVLEQVGPHLKFVPVEVESEIVSAPVNIYGEEMSNGTDAICRFQVVLSGQN